MIIKGNRGPKQPEDEPKAGPDPPQSALIKRLGGGPAPPSVVHTPRSNVMKRGTYTHVERGQEREPQVSDEPQGEAPVLRVGRPHGAAMGPTAADAGPTLTVSSGPPPDLEILEEAQRRAEAIVRQAQMDAKKLLEEAKIYAQQQFQQAEQTGFEQGRQQGYDQTRRETIDLVHQARIMLAQTIGAREKFFRSMQAEIAQLAMKIAERVTATMAADSEELIKNQVSATLEKVKDRQEIVVHVNPDDLLVAREHRGMFERLLESPKNFDVVGDPKVDRGGCIIETNLGNVDARVSTQLRALKLAFDEIIALEREEIERAAAEAERVAMAQVEAERAAMAQAEAERAAAMAAAQAPPPPPMEEMPPEGPPPEAAAPEGAG